MNRHVLAAVFGSAIASAAAGAAENYQRAHELGSMRVCFDPPGLKYVLSEAGEDEDRGWREDRPVPPRASAGVRMVCIGDSVTFGVNVGVQETWCANVRRGLGRGNEAYNFGMNGYDAEQVATLLATRVAAWKPDVVVWGAYMNDVFPTYLLYGLKSGKPVFVGSDIPEQARILPETVALLLVRNSALFRGLQGATYARSELRAGPRQPDPDWYGDQVARIADWARINSVPVVALAMGPHALADRTTCPQQFPVAGLCEASEAQYRTMTIELEARGLPWIDGLAALQSSGERDFHPPGRLDPDHPNAAGHRVLADAALPAVRAALGLADPATPATTDELVSPPTLRAADGARVRGGGRRP